MTTVGFLAEWAVRSSALIACGALVLWVVRVKDASIRLAAWTAMLAGSLAIPALTISLPKVPVAVMSTVSAPAIENLPSLAPLSPTVTVPRSFDWWRVAIAIYVFVALVLLLRLSIGLVVSLRLLRAGRETGRMAEGIAVLESNVVKTPVTLGIVRPKIVLPGDWREWDEPKLGAVLAHERSHIRRGDPALQVLSAIHRAILWHSPMSWFLHRWIVRTAEEASDDAAVAVTGDRASYAEVLLEFMQRGTRRAAWLGVPMARYGRVERRIHRILDGVALSRGITRWSVTAIVACALPLAYVAATARPSQAASQAPVAPAPTAAAPIPKPASPATPPAPAPPRIRSAGSAKPGYLMGLGTVSAATLMVRSKVDGELKSVGFEEGKAVEAGQLLATVAPQDTQSLLERAHQELDADRQRLARAQQLDSSAISPNNVQALRAQVEAGQRNVDNFERVMAYGQIRAPFAGVAGLRKIDPGNLVHTGDVIVVITQVQPIAVLFSVPEDNLPEVMALLRAGGNPTVEAWNRDMTVKLATGKLTAVDNEINKETGTATIKAIFDNKDGALFPGQFVNARLSLDRR